jgi:hypothetical protein
MPARRPRGRLLDQHQQVLAADAHGRDRPLARVQAKSQGSFVEIDRPVEVRDGDPHRAEAEGGRK